MDLVEGRGISSGNDVYFIFDAENDVVVMAIYREAPGVRSDLLKPHVIKTFTKDEWGDINEFLMAGADRYEEEEGLRKLEEMEVDEAFTPKVMDLPTANVAANKNIAGENIKPPKMSNAEAILPENKVPAMTKSEQEKEKEENGKE